METCGYCRRGGIGVYIEHLAVLARCNGGNNGDIFIFKSVIYNVGIDFGYLAYKSDVRFCVFYGFHHFAVDTAKAYRLAAVL